MQELVIEAGRTERQTWKDLWRYRELFYFLAWRDVLVRYKQTVVGTAWAIIRPLLTTVVLTVVFGKLAKLPSGDVPYPVLVLTGMLPWQFFATAISDSGNSLVQNASLISKVYFPRLTVPFSSVVAGLVDFGISAAMLAGVLIWSGLLPGRTVLLVPLFVLVAAVTSLGAGVWISALTVESRDFRFIVPFIVQFGLYLSPVAFMSEVVPERWRLLYSLNPMVGAIDGFRWAILGDRFSPYWPGFALSLVIVCLMMVTGIAYFRKTERTFADVI